MSSRTLTFFGLFPALLGAQRPASVDRQLAAAGLWAEARYNYAYWDVVRANWDSAFAATVTFTEARPAPSDLQFLRRLRRWGALLNDGQLELLAPAAVANRIARPPLALRSIERRPFIIDYVVNDEMRVARPERLAEILAVQGIPAAAWIRDSVVPEVAATNEASRWERAVAQMLDGERGTALHLLLRLPGGAERGASVTRTLALTARSSLDRAAHGRRRGRLRRRISGGRARSDHRRADGREHGTDGGAAARARMEDPPDRVARRVPRRQGIRGHRDRARHPGGRARRGRARRARCGVGSRARLPQRNGPALGLQLRAEEADHRAPRAVC